MKRKIERRAHKVTYDLFKRVEDGDFEYIYRGIFTQTLTRKILGLAESNLQKFVDKSSLQNRIYFIMVEGLQNVTRHQEDAFDQTNDNSGIFAIQKLGDKYLITTGNLIVNSKVDTLKQKLNEVNSLDRDELKKLHKEILSTGELSDKGGAGLGLIEMARRSGNRLLFDFEYVDLYWSYFYLQTEIPSRSQNKFEIENAQEMNTMRDAKHLNSILAKRDILLNFNGNFNQSNILSLLSIIKGQMSLNKAVKKVYYIMVEMLQNISKHGKNFTNNEEGASGIFFLGQNEEEFILTAGNHIDNSSVESFRERLETVNELNSNELNESFNKILLDQSAIDPKKTGLGFIDIRLKCSGKLEYDFRRIDEEYSFYTIKATVKI